jgi:glycosyltransferase involved in cell wall biosynthesis
MHCPNLIELHSPLPTQIGWPWTKATSYAFENPMGSESSWPKISIVTPSYNQGLYIEETIRSVLLQGYPNLEYIIIDGGSIDESMEIIKKYEHWLAYWVSEPDKGQSHAINKGMEKATGDLVAWINSDDVYKQGAFYHVASIFIEHPELGLIYGLAEMVDNRSQPTGQLVGEPFSLESMISKGNLIPQPSTFFRADAFRKAGGVSEDYDFAMDFDLWLKIGLNHHVYSENTVWSQFRIHSASKSGTEKIEFRREDYEIIKQFFRGNADRIMEKPKVLARYSLRLAQCYKSVGNNLRAWEWAFRALGHDPTLAWSSNREGKSFYSILLGANLFKKLLGIRRNLYSPFK